MIQKYWPKFCIIFDTKPKINCNIFVTKREEEIRNHQPMLV